MCCVGKEYDKNMLYEHKKLYLINRVADRHTSVLEHIVYQFKIEGLSRAALQELARHRMASYSVQSTRWALKKLLGGKWNDKEASELLKSIDDGGEIDTANLHQLYNVYSEIERGVKNDIAKYGLPEAFLTTLFMTVNARSLRNFFGLRTSKRALKEMRELANRMIMSIGTDELFLFSDIIGGKK
jgi:thymidylate synthase (FAD)